MACCFKVYKEMHTSRAEAAEENYVPCTSCSSASLAIAWLGKEIDCILVKDFDFILLFPALAGFQRLVSVSPSETVS